MVTRGSYWALSGLQWRESCVYPISSVLAVCLQCLVCFIVFGLCLRVGMVLIRCVSSVYVGVIKIKLAFRLVCIILLWHIWLGSDGLCYFCCVVWCVTDRSVCVRSVCVYGGMFYLLNFLD